MKNLVILQGDSHNFNETYSGEYNNPGDSDVLLTLVNLVTGDFVTSGDFSESAYPGNSVDFDEDFDFSGESGYYGKYGDIGESGNSSAIFGSGECGVFRQFQWIWSSW